MNSLDYELLYETECKEWQVWSPDQSGAVVGSGAGQTAALLDAIGNMAGTIVQMHREVSELRNKMKPL